LSSTPTSHGVTLNLHRPPLPLVFFCGSKKKPSDLIVSVKWKGEWTSSVDTITMNVTVGTLTHPPVTIKYTNQKRIELLLKLSSGYELRPVKFSTHITITTKDQRTDTYVVKDTHCVLMTAPSTQRRKALSALAWQELTPFLCQYKPQTKNAKVELVCDVAQIDDSLRGRWGQIFEHKYPYPDRFTHLLSPLTKNAFFHSLLLTTRQNHDPLLTKLKEKEFRKVWSWYEAVFGFIEEYHTLFFNLNVPQIQGRHECEQSLQQNPSAPRTFTLRFASEENLVSLSVFKRSSGCSHMSVPFKEITFLAEYINILEKNKFSFIDYRGNIAVISPNLRKLPMFAKQESKVTSGYLNPMASITEAISDQSDPNGSGGNQPQPPRPNVDQWSPTTVAEYFRNKGVPEFKNFQYYQITGGHLNLTYLSGDRLLSMGFSDASVGKILHEIRLLRGEPLKPEPNSPYGQVTSVESPQSGVGCNYQMPNVGVKRERPHDMISENPQQQPLFSNVDALIQMLLSPTPDEGGVPQDHTPSNEPPFVHPEMTNQGPSPNPPQQRINMNDHSNLYGDPRASNGSLFAQQPNTRPPPHPSNHPPNHPPPNNPNSLFPQQSGSLFPISKQEPTSLKDFLSKPGP